MTTTTQPFITSSTDDNRGQIARLLRRLSPPTLILIAIMLLAAVLNLANVDSLGDGNTYYTAAVKAMLQSPANFFFVAAEPGGSVTIDKPPLGLWLQAISAFFLGVNGIAVVLPQILAGIFSVPLLYFLVKRHFGTGAGLIAALVTAVMPVSVAVQRNNTMDATLIFALLLAAWAFIKAMETGKLRWLLAGGVLVGLGFNIKMLQAFLPLPAFYALYFLGAKVGWRRKVAHLALTTIVLLAVSLAWIVAVDLTPADQRPYVGSSDTNSALELAIGYNGLQRLLGRMGGGPPNDGGDGGTDDRQFAPPTGADDQALTPPTGAAPPAGAPNAGGGMFGNEIGTAGVLRLFSQPLDNEIGWLLPFGLFSLVLLIVAARPRWPLSTAHKGAILWGGWLVTEIVFFSMAGFFHAYYMAMLTPPLAALVGIGVMRLWRLHEQRKLLAIALLIASVGATLAYQVTIAAGYTDVLIWMAIPAMVLVVGASVLVLARFVRRFSQFALAGFACAVVALTATPTVWAGMTTMQAGENSVLPAAYGGNARMGGQPPNAAANGDGPQDRAGPDGGFGGGGVDADLLAYLQANTEGMRYMMAVGSSQQGAGYVLETGRGVLYMGGFSGQDPVVDAESLQALVDAGELRYVLSGGDGRGGRGGMGTNSTVSDWLAQTCSVVTDVSTNNGTLYDCVS